MAPKKRRSLSAVAKRPLAMPGAKGKARGFKGAAAKAAKAESKAAKTQAKAAAAQAKAEAKAEAKAAAEAKADAKAEAKAAKAAAKAAKAAAKAAKAEAKAAKAKAKGAPRAKAKAQAGQEASCDEGAGVKRRSPSPCSSNVAALQAAQPLAKARRRWPRAVFASGQGGGPSLADILAKPTTCGAPEGTVSAVTSHDVLSGSALDVVSKACARLSLPTLKKQQGNMPHVINIGSGCSGSGMDHFVAKALQVPVWTLEETGLAVLSGTGQT